MRYILPRPVVAGNQEDKSTHANFFCNQIQITIASQLLCITFNLSLYFSMIALSSVF